MTKRMRRLTEAQDFAQRVGDKKSVKFFENLHMQTNGACGQCIACNEIFIHPGFYLEKRTEDDFKRILEEAIQRSEDFYRGTKRVVSRDGIGPECLAYLRMYNFLHYLGVEVEAVSTRWMGKKTLDWVAENGFLPNLVIHGRHRDIEDAEDKFDGHYMQVLAYESENGGRVLYFNTSNDEYKKGTGLQIRDLLSLQRRWRNPRADNETWGMILLPEGTEIPKDLFPRARRYSLRELEKRRKRV